MSSDGQVISLNVGKTLLSSPPIYKPFKYPWAYEAWSAQQKMHWLPDEVPLGDDCRDWNNMPVEQRNLLTQIFRFFTQQDVEVSDCYMTKYSAVFKPTEVKMMLTAFANMETIHIAAYSHLLDTIGMPEVEYSAFLRYKEMKDKHDYLQSFTTDSVYDIALTLAAFGAFVEGVQLFASFAILLNFQRFGKMRGMGQIVTWSARDETLHSNSIIKLFHVLCQENAHAIPSEKLDQAIYQMARTMVEQEDHFIDLAFELGPMPDLTAEQVKRYVRYLADRQLIKLGRLPIFGVSRNPLPWMEETLNAIEFANFFEARPTEYTRANTVGEWDDAYSSL